MASRWLMAAVLAALAGCAGPYGSGPLKPGARLPDVQRVMGAPALRWQEPDGSLQLSYPRGPWGFHSYMVYLGPDGRLTRVENVMDPAAFVRIRPGMSQEAVLRVLGPSEPRWTSYFPARDELVWEWRYCDEWNEAARFDVLFDGTRKTVRSTLRHTEAQMGLCSEGSCWCAR